ncbi:Protein dpy-30 [Orchesella cincta]|uniref:Protein dpy-30 n=1 Tax=Orchesella cincta TaxID=48709 RepID=A0A1D2MUC6_ORCCI|nr:Protein dpy-30 [Orchesella cincta]
MQKAGSERSRSSGRSSGRRQKETVVVVDEDAQSGPKSADGRKRSSGSPAPVGEGAPPAGTENEEENLAVVSPADMTKIQGSASEGTGTSISSQIQKVIAKELVMPGKKGKIDLQSVPMREYLEQTVIQIVHQGMLALARERPDSPIEYLAAYFLKHKHKYLHQVDVPEQDKPPQSRQSGVPETNLNNENSQITETQTGGNFQQNDIVTN